MNPSGEISPPNELLQHITLLIVLKYPIRHTRIKGKTSTQHHLNRADLNEAGFSAFADGGIISLSGG